MRSRVSRRRFLGAAGTVAAAGAVGAAQEGGDGVKIVAVCCSPRKEKSTWSALRACLEGSKAADPRVAVEVIELAGKSIPAQLAAGLPLEPGEKDDFPRVAETLADPRVRGIIVGSPVYFGNMTALCKAFLDRCIAFRKEGFLLANKVGGVLAVGGARNGGQELTIQSIQTALLCQEMIVVGDGRPTAHFGATLWNESGGGVEGDAFGLATARNLGRRVAEVALLLAG